MRHAIILGVILGACCGWAEMRGEAPVISGSAAATGKESPLLGSLEFSYAPFALPGYRWSESLSPSEGSRVNAFRVLAAWLPYTGPGGKLEVGLGTGYYFASGVPFGASQFANLEIFPALVHASYRFDFFKDQLVVPFARLAAEVDFVNQTSATGVEISGTRLYYGLNYSIGGQLCLNAIDETAANWFEKSIGVNNTYLQVEYLKSVYLLSAAQPDLTRQELNLALRFEY